MPVCRSRIGLPRIPGGAVVGETHLGYARSRVGCGDRQRDTACGGGGGPAVDQERVRDRRGHVNDRVRVGGGIRAAVPHLIVRPCAEGIGVAVLPTEGGGSGGTGADPVCPDPRCAVLYLHIVTRDPAGRVASRPRNTEGQAGLVCVQCGHRRTWRGGVQRDTARHRCGCVTGNILVAGIDRLQFIARGECPGLAAGKRLPRIPGAAVVGETHLGHASRRISGAERQTDDGRGDDGGTIGNDKGTGRSHGIERDRGGDARRDIADRILVAGIHRIQAVACSELPVCRNGIGLPRIPGAAVVRETHLGHARRHVSRGDCQRDTACGRGGGPAVDEQCVCDWRGHVNDRVRVGCGIRAAIPHLVVRPCAERIRVAVLPAKGGGGGRTGADPVRPDPRCAVLHLHIVVGDPAGRVASRPRNAEGQAGLVRTQRSH